MNTLIPNNKKISQLSDEERDKFKQSLVEHIGKENLDALASSFTDFISTLEYSISELSPVLPDNKNITIQDFIENGLLEQILNTAISKSNLPEKTKHELEKISYLPKLAPLPSTEIPPLLFRMINSGERGIKKSSVTRTEQITLEEYIENGIQYTKCHRKNKGKEQTIILSDAAEILTGRNKTFQKIFIFTLQKIAQQHNPRSVHFSLSELVSTGMYKSNDSARRAVKTFFQQQSQIQFFKTIKSRGKQSEAGGFLFYNYDITNGYVTLSINDKFPVVPLLAEQYTIFPRFAYGLKSDAFSLTHYIFYLARQNADKIKKNNIFTISLESIRNYLGLPTVQELSVTDRLYKKRIQEPIENAIEEIEEAIWKSQEEYNGSFTITPYITEGQGIGTWLEGYISIGLSGEYSDMFNRISISKQKNISSYKKEKIRASAQLAARSETAKNKPPKSTL